jgi:hypothetical protein
MKTIADRLQPLPENLTKGIGSGISYKSLFKGSIKGCSARQNRLKKRNVHAVREYFSVGFNAAMRPSASLWAGSKGLCQG